MSRWENFVYCFETLCQLSINFLLLPIGSLNLDKILEGYEHVEIYCGKGFVERSRIGFFKEVWGGGVS